MFNNPGNRAGRRTFLDGSETEILFNFNNTPSSSPDFTYKSVALPVAIAPVIANIGAAGATTYSYQLVVNNVVGRRGPGATVTTATGNATLDGTNFNRLTMPVGADVSSYDIWRTVSGGSPGDLGWIGNAAPGAVFDDKGIATWLTGTTAFTTRDSTKGEGILTRITAGDKRTDLSIHAQGYLSNSFSAITGLLINPPESDNSGAVSGVIQWTTDPGTSHAQAGIYGASIGNGANIPMVRAADFDALLHSGSADLLTPLFLYMENAWDPAAVATLGTFISAYAYIDGGSTTTTFNGIDLDGFFGSLPGAGSVINITDFGATLPGSAVHVFDYNSGVTRITNDGVIKAAGYKSSDGSAGATTTITTASLVGKTITVKNGLITSFA